VALVQSVFFINSNAMVSECPNGFVLVSDVVPDVILEMRYYSTYNFVGCRVDSYNAPVAILSLEAANALKKASDILKSKGYVIKIFDAYRPQQAVDHFVRWAQDIQDTKMKEAFYPQVDKGDLFRLGYIAEKSGHTRGSTVDLTIVDIKTGEEIDMGSPFDFFGSISHHDTNLISAQQTANRKILKNAMGESGFKSYHEEW
jgi:zinc D-Ala-D-Ala dipeptidase